MSQRCSLPPGDVPRGKATTKGAPVTQCWGAGCSQRWEQGCGSSLLLSLMSC